MYACVSYDTQDKQWTQCRDSWHVREWNSIIFNIFISMEKNWKWKDCLTAGMSYVMLPAMMRLVKCMWLMFYVFLIHFPLSYLYFSLRPRVGKEWLAYQWGYTYHNLRNCGLLVTLYTARFNVRTFYIMSTECIYVFLCLVAYRCYFPIGLLHWVVFKAGAETVHCA